MMSFSKSTKGSVAWQRDKFVVGAFEYTSEPTFHYRTKQPLQHVVPGKEAEFEECLELWKTLALRKTFIEACQSVPTATQCCGLAPDFSQTVVDTAEALNAGWVKYVNKNMKAGGYKISCFVVHCGNTGGRAKSTKLMVRFHIQSTRRFQMISQAPKGPSVIRRMMDDLDMPTDEVEFSERTREASYSSFAETP